MNPDRVSAVSGQPVRTGGHPLQGCVLPMSRTARADLSAPDDGAPFYLRPEEVAELLRLSVKSVYRLAAEDPELPVLKLGRTVRFPRERLLKWLKDREQGPGRAGRRLGQQVLSAGRDLSSRPLAQPADGADGSCAQDCAQMRRAMAAEHAPLAAPRGAPAPAVRAGNLALGDGHCQATVAPPGGNAREPVKPAKKHEEGDA